MQALILRRLAFGIALLLEAPLVHAQVDITSPRGGWREAPSVQRDFTQEVHYPASRVNATGLDEPALIRGKIERISKDQDRDGQARRPARLVVDGIAMPLSLDEDGSFARPWSFGKGSHSLEVRHGEGRRRVQFLESRSGRRSVRLRIVLSWDSDHTDLDLHVLSPDGVHVFYGNRLGSNGGALDVDVTTGFGPEIFATPQPLRGAYHVYVNYYGAGELQDAVTTAQVAVIQNEGLPDEKQQTFRVPLRKPGELTLVRSFLMP